MSVDTSVLLQEIVDLAVDIVKWAGPVIVAWLTHRFAIRRLVKHEAVEAERTIGPKQGAKKHASVKKRIKGTWLGKTVTGMNLDEIIKHEGREAANKYRNSIPPKAGQK